MGVATATVAKALPEVPGSAITMYKIIWRNFFEKISHVTFF